MAAAVHEVAAGIHTRVSRIEDVWVMIEGSHNLVVHS